MPFIDSTQKREVQQRFIDYEPPKEEDVPSFGETFAAGLGLVVDEELSVSSAFNHEQRRHRDNLIFQKIKNGEVDLNRYPKGPNIPYGEIASDLNDPEIMTDVQLGEKRREMLAKRRSYAQDVIERGSGTAQFLGAMTGYILDPVNLLTVGVGTTVAAGRATTVMGRALLTARDVALVDAATELGIQGLVYSHKQEIDSPYTMGDALSNIAMAATGSAAIGAVSGGLGAWFKQVRQKTKELPPTPELVEADAMLGRMEATLKAAPKVETVKADLRAQVLDDLREELIQESSNKLTRSEVKALKTELDSLKSGKFSKEYNRPKGKTEVEIQVKGYKNLPEGAKRQVQDQIDLIEKQLNQHEAATKAAKDLSKVDKGVLPRKYKDRIDKLATKKQIESDLEFINSIESKRDAVSEPSKTVEKYPEPELDLPPVEKPITKGRERTVMDELGIADQYDRELAEFDRLENPLLFMDEETGLADARAVVAQIDDEIAGVESVLECVIAQSSV